MRRTLLALVAAAFIAGLPTLGKADSGDKMGPREDGDVTR